MHTSKLLIVDDQRLFADGLRVLIESRAPEFNVIGIAENGQQAIEMVRAERPDLVLMDVRMPTVNGVDATKAIISEFPDTKISIITTFADEEYIHDSLENGAIGYLLKNRPAEELILSIRAFAAGIVQLDPEVSNTLLSAERERRSKDVEFSARLLTLSPREVEVLKLMTKSHRIRPIAEELGIAEQTVRNHMSNMYQKLGIHDRMEIVNYIGAIKSFLEGSS